MYRAQSSLFVRSSATWHRWHDECFDSYVVFFFALVFFFFFFLSADCNTSRLWCWRTGKGPQWNHHRQNESFEKGVVNGNHRLFYKADSSILIFREYSICCAKVNFSTIVRDRWFQLRPLEKKKMKKKNTLGRQSSAGRLARGNRMGCPFTLEDGFSSR